MKTTDPDLIHDVIAVTGAQLPDWLDPSAPVLQANPSDEPLYLIGVIGGKDVGKSSLINALIGTTITRTSAFGEGTAKAVAYVHHDDAAAARSLLSAVIPDQFEIATHANPDDRRRVLLDLPDIDSVWNEHVELTRKLLRHMLYPIWVQSIEKYADREPLQLLAKVSSGNSPENFLFALTKCDQLVSRHGPAALDELRNDYALRVARACGLQTPPKVFALNGLDAAAFDLPDLAQQVLTARSIQTVARSRDLAQKQQNRTVDQWLRSQKIDQLLQVAERQLAEAREIVAERLSEPLVDQLSNRLAGDASFRTQIVEPVVRARLAYWPIINVIDAVLGPVVSIVRTGPAVPAIDALAGRDLATHVRGTFADLTRRDPQFLQYFSHNKLWEIDPASRAAATVQQSVEDAIARHQSALTENNSRPTLLTRLLAPVLTIGAARWFPIV
ncbi:MAG: 50S ribosome-binding GTPase, partial [Burkholderiales bacterium]|nr:50S ribosome-binding GTPase [Phycisphaerae bacterium]